MRTEGWRPAAAACNRSPREAREVARQALRPGCEELAERIRVMPETEARPRVKNRHGGAPRGERPASWDARRLASAWRAASCARPTGVPPSTRTSLGAPPTPRFGVSEAKLQTPGADMRRGNELVRLRQGYGGLDHWPAGASAKAGGLFDIVSCEVRDPRPHPEERACASAPAKSNARTRVSKDEDERLRAPSCFETHRSAPSLRKRLCSLALRCSSA